MSKKEDELQKEIARLKEKLAEQTDTIKGLKTELDECRTREQSVSSAILSSIEHSNQLEISRDKMLRLDMQRLRLIYLKMEQAIQKLYVKYPELREEEELKDMSEKFRDIINSDLKEMKLDPVHSAISRSKVSDDPIKKLLKNIVDTFDTKKADVKVTKRISADPLAEHSVSKSGFDFDEALHPTMELGEIMKSFNLGSKKDN